MGISKRNSVVALAKTSAYNTTAAAAVYLICDDCNIEAESQKYERINNTSRDSLGAQPAGFKHSFFAKGIEPDAATLGYLIWLALGGQSMNVSDQHVLVPDEVPPYLQFFLDRGLDLGTSTPTETVVGGMIKSFELDIQMNKFVKLSIDGIACDFGALGAALTAVEPDYPLSWHSLRAGDCKLGYNGAAVASDRTIRGVKINFSQEIRDEDNITLDSDQPIGLTATTRKASFEIMRQFDGANAKAEYLAWKNQQEVGLQLLFSMNSAAETVQLDIPYGEITGSYAGGGGSGDDIIMATLKCDAYKPSGGNLMTVTVDDGNASNYA